MDNLTIYKKFKVVPKEAQKEILGGRLKGFTDINPMWRIKMLTEQFGVCGFGWKYEIVSQETKVGANNEISAFVTINLYIKIDDVWSAPIPALGGSAFVANERNGLYTSDECFKMAFTDALSIACKSLGMGADVYFEKDRTKYNDQAEQVLPKATQPTKAPEQKATPPKPAEVAIDLVAIEAAIKAITTKKEMGEYWKANKALQSNPDFTKLVTAYGSKLTK